MKVAIDYDDTYTLDRGVWKSLVLFLRGSGADIRFVTYRYPDGNEDDLEPDAADLGIPIIYCSGKQKKHVTESIDWNPDVWIDDSPETIVSLKDMRGFSNGCIVNNDLGSDATFKDHQRHIYYSNFKATGEY